MSSEYLTSSRDITFFGQLFRLKRHLCVIAMGGTMNDAVVVFGEEDDPKKVFK